jgi:hypothetical protein
MVELVTVAAGMLLVAATMNATNFIYAQAPKGTRRCSRVRAPRSGMECAKP